MASYAVLAMTSTLLIRHFIKESYKPKNKYQPHACKTKLPLKDLVVSAAVAKMAYQSPSEINPSYISFVSKDLRTYFIDTFGKQDFVYYEAKDKHEDTQAYMWIKNKVAYVAFRGTECKKDALADLDVRHYDLGKGVRTHKGFQKQFNAIEKDIFVDLKLKSEMYNEVHFIGHSLGGALATIAAAHYASVLNDKKVHCYTFGCPRVGNEGFSKWYAQNIAVENSWRVFNFEDPVPMVPWSWRFHHVPYNNVCLSTQINCLDVHKHDCHWLVRPLHNALFINLFEPIKAHDCSDYVFKLEMLYLDCQNIDDQDEKDVKTVTD